MRPLTMDITDYSLVIKYHPNMQVKIKAAEEKIKHCFETRNYDEIEKMEINNNLPDEIRTMAGVAMIEYYKKHKIYTEIEKRKDSVEFPRELRVKAEKTLENLAIELGKNFL